jgi:hypothetical protein
MLARIEARKAYKRFELALTTHNENCPEQTHKRTRRVAGGAPIVVDVVRKVGTIKQAVKESFYVILSQYIHHYNHVAANMPAGMYTTQDPPSLLTNCVRLAEVCGCSDRTVRNHIGKLRRLGIVRTKFHGRQKDFELWISLEVLYGGEGEDFQKMRSGALNSGVGKNFPPNNTHREIFEKENESADMCVEHGENIHGERGRAETDPSPQEKGQEGPLVEEQREGGTRGARAAKVAHNEQKRLSRASQLMDELTPRPPQGLPTRYLNMLVDFWIYAMKMLYPEREFSKEQQEKALAAIAAGVYNNFTDARTDQEWLDFQLLQLTKIDKAARYYEHHPEAYLPDPYAVHVPGKGYFDRENRRGFVGINAWLQREAAQRAINKQAYHDKKASKEAYNAKMLLRARRDFEKMKAGLPARKAVENLSLTELYHYWLTVFSGFGKKWKTKFMQQYVDQQARNFLPPKIHRPRRQRQLADTPTAETVVYVQSWMNGDGQGYYSE